MNLKQSRFLIPLGVFVGVAGLLWLGLALKPRIIDSPFIGKAAPAFNTNRLLTDARLSPADLHGQVWLLNVWASWCAACLDEHPLLNWLAMQGDAPIIGLNYKDDAAAAKKWLTTHGNPYTAIAVDARGDIGIDYGVYGVPETFVIDKNGIVRLKHIGPLTQDSLTQQVLPLVLQLTRAPDEAD